MPVESSFWAAFKFLPVVSVFIGVYLVVRFVRKILS